MTGLVWDPGVVPVLRWLGAPAGVVVAFSSREGGVSERAYASLNLGAYTGDDPLAVAENRRRFCASVGASPSMTACVRQTHSNIVHEAAQLPASYDDLTLERPEGDAIVVRTAAAAAVALGADCVPIAIARIDGSAVAACHAGWRGLVGGVVENAVRAVGGEAVAVIGPCAGPDRYEVGSDVSDLLVTRYGPETMRGRNADLAGAARLALLGAGAVRVDLARICTIADDRFFSHRRDGTPGGRQGVVVSLR